MALLELWKTSPKELQDKHVQQVISFSGDGKLKDGSAASDEFRQLLAFVPSAILVRYANQCLDDKFENSGLALQDVINEVGKRLGFQVEQGRYRGFKGWLGSMVCGERPSKTRSLSRSRQRTHTGWTSTRSHATEAL